MLFLPKAFFGFCENRSIMNYMFKHVHILGKATEKKNLGVKLVLAYLPNRYFIATLYNLPRNVQRISESPSKFYKAVLELHHSNLADQKQNKSQLIKLI